MTDKPTVIEGEPIARNLVTIKAVRRLASLCALR